MKTQNHTCHPFGKFHWIGAAACVLGLLITTGTSALAQSSGQTRPFHAEAENTRTSVGSPWTYLTHGKSSHLGRITGGGVKRITGFSGNWLIMYGEAVDTMVAANGDELYATYTWSMNWLAPVPDRVIYATYGIDGGTGRFENATGNGTAVALYNDAGNLDFVIDGVINY